MTNKLVKLSDLDSLLLENVPNFEPSLPVCKKPGDWKYNEQVIGVYVKYVPHREYGYKSGIHTIETKDGRVTFFGNTVMNPCLCHAEPGDVVCVQSKGPRLGQNSSKKTFMFSVARLENGQWVQMQAKPLPEQEMVDDLEF